MNNFLSMVSDFLAMVNEFLAMGGYAAFVWPAFAVFFIVLLIDFFAPGVRRRRILREVNASMRRKKQTGDR